MLKKYTDEVFDDKFGLQVIDFNGGRDAAYSVVELHDGYVLSGPVVAINTDFGSVKLNKINGQINPSFGKVTTNFPNSSTDVPVVSILLRNNTFLLAGTSQFGSPGVNNLLFALAKYRSDGKLDNTFGTDIFGKFNGGGLVYNDVDPRGVNDEIFGVAQDNKCRIVATGFSNPGQATGAGPAFNFGTCRYLPNGVLDVCFGMNGRVVQDIMNNNDDRANDVIIFEDNSMIVGGRTKFPNATNFNYALVRYKESGRIDKNFGRYVGQVFNNLSIQRGIVINNFGGDDLIIKLIKLRNNKFLAAGRSGNSFIIVRYYPNGQVDSTFGTGGFNRFNFELGSVDTLNGAFIDRSEKFIYLVGNSALGGVNRFAIAKLYENGTFDLQFGGTGRKIFTFPQTLTSGFLRNGLVDQAGNVVVVGEGVRIGQTTADFVAFKLVKA